MLSIKKSLRLALIIKRLPILLNIKGDLAQVAAREEVPTLPPSLLKRSRRTGAP
jgi:hypothetical protein